MHKRKQSSIESSSVLTELAARYARFRGEHPRGARIPSELREATLSALDKGVAATALYRSCGISWGQVRAWQASRPLLAERAAMVRAADPPDVRVFSVVDDQPLSHGAPELAVGNELELRLGSWSVTVRLADRGQTGEG